MKINSTYVWSNLVAVPVLFYIITYLFYRGNTDAYDYVDTYLKQSKVIKLTIPKKNERKRVFYSFRFGKKGRRNCYQFIFYSAEYKKYLAIVSFSDIDTFGEIDLEEPSRGFLYSEQPTIFAYANITQWNDAKYGTKKLPMPIFFIKATHLYNNQLTIGPWDSSSSPCIIDYNSTRKFVEQYLAYFLPEDEFDRLFKGKEE
ncbi:hypothetical protein [Hoylesella loescheii]|uniref:DUF8188 domain-containing protein n=1 Tax=Hoylesella loescheii DSM 19665 = JCM 12249 = ATCC 15930 TaxID=1122985 RepID=A0A069QI75_HOYLO|nr:hypothetical protein [Hoylesella loescheii]KDR52553.1 hypothetical protein HMPREF1991_01365 [Hoylesella loescheii DSM 19665 = JCM 12249 = ATCC 15930]